MGSARPQRHHASVIGTGTVQVTSYAWVVPACKAVELIQSASRTGNAARVKVADLNRARRTHLLVLSIANGTNNVQETRYAITGFVTLRLRAVVLLMTPTVVLLAVFLVTGTLIAHSMRYAITGFVTLMMCAMGKTMLLISVIPTIHRARSVRGVGPTGTAGGMKYAHSDVAGNPLRSVYTENKAKRTVCFPVVDSWSSTTKRDPRSEFRSVLYTRLDAFPSWTV